MRGCQIKSWEQMFKLEPFSLQSDSPRQGVRVEVLERKHGFVEQLGLCACPQGWAHAQTHSPLAGIYQVWLSPLQLRGQFLWI